MTTSTEDALLFASCRGVFGDCTRCFVTYPDPLCWSGTSGSGLHASKSKRASSTVDCFLNSADVCLPTFCTFFASHIMHHTFVISNITQHDFFQTLCFCIRRCLTHSTTREVAGYAALQRSF
uniref:(northern house mosquito) hypothetical protein n=1 Tax=Culex pipiens TaxID=7175 RepID=A0A8D8CQW1_CULPI